MNLPKPELPSGARQGVRLGNKFQQIETSLDRDWSATPPLEDEIAPDRLLVFEVVQDIPNIAGQLKKLGFLWVGDLEQSYISDDDFRQIKENKPFDGRILATVPTKQALNRLLEAWRAYQNDQLAPTGAMAQLFGSLKDLRRWGPRDRLGVEALSYLNECLREAPNEPIPLELELWPYPDQQRRNAALETVRQAVVADQGVIVSSADIPGAGYLAVLVRVRPAVAAALTKAEDVRISVVDTIQFIGPRAQTITGPAADEADGISEEALDAITKSMILVPDVTEADPDVALLDGLPLTQHKLLEPLLEVHPPDELSLTTAWSTAPTEARRHGTAMASLILYEDLATSNEGYRRKLLVRPILRPSQNYHGGWDENIPDDMLFGDILHRAILDLKRGRNGQPAAAPNLKIISLSVGDARRPFHGIISGAAKVLDWLSNEFNLLFVVSAGNWTQPLTLKDTEGDVRSGRADIADVIFRQDNAEIISPAEAINALTVGSVHHDQGGRPPQPRWIVPLDTAQVPAPYTRRGPGLHGSVKPDICVAGGRLPYMFNILHRGPGSSIKPAPQAARDLQQIGQQVAAPGIAGDLDGRAWTAGTSNSAAITSGAAGRILETLRELSGEYTDERGRPLLDEAYWPVLTKALLVHGARWEDEAFLLNHFGVAGAADRAAKTRARESVRRYMGHGIPDFHRVIECTRQRATLLGVGSLGPNDAAVFELPLPVSGWDRRCIRRITTTAAWFSPVLATRAGYRVAQLSVAWDDDLAGFVGVSSTGGDARHANGKGTIWHEVKETAPKLYQNSPGDALKLRVQCRDVLGALSSGVRFGLAVSFEIVQGRPDVRIDDIDIYADIAVRTRPSVRTRV